MPGLEPVGIINASEATANAVTNASMSAFDIAKRVLTFPSRLYARIRLIDELLQENAERQAESIAEQYRLAHPDAPLPVRGRHLTMPGPWAFFMSGYAVAVIILMFLLNRIQNVVVPLRESRYDTSGLPWYRRIFPLDMGSTTTRVIIRLPTVILCLRSFALWATITAQSASFFPSWRILQPLGDWAAAKTMDEICWTVFISVAAALAIASFTRGLEGHTHIGNAQPFNVVGFAFTHHMYSQVITHEETTDTPSRPNKHVLIMMLIPLLQITMLHILGASRRLARERLIPTAICSVLNLAHYHYVLWVSPTAYPLVNFFSGALDSSLLLIIALTVGLRALGELCTRGAVTSPLLGHADALVVRRDEDFPLALLRLGTAALDTTAVAGLGNALAPVSAPLSSGVLLTQAEAEMPSAVGAEKGGFANEIKSVHAKNSDDDAGAGGADTRAMLAFCRALVAVARGSAVWLWAVVRRQPLPELVPEPSQAPRPGPLTRASSVVPAGTIHHSPSPEEAAYARFLQGEVDADEDGDTDYDPAQYIRASSTSLLSESDSDSQDDDAESAEETVGLYSDTPPAPLLFAHMASSGNAPLTRGQFRRLAPGYATGVAATNEDADVNSSTVIQRHVRQATPVLVTSPPPQLPPPAPPLAKSDVSSAMCVVCADTPRDIILWPCRCLAMCDDCRANLASRASASKHACPCCRQHVEGYSRIYIP